MSFDAEDCEPCDFQDVRRHRARKDHRCDACKAFTIRRGDWYTYTVLKCDGEFEHIRRCERCQAIYEHLAQLGAACEDERFPAQRLDCGETYQAEWDRDPPPEIAALAFWLPGDPIHQPKESEGRG